MKKQDKAAEYVVDMIPTAMIRTEGQSVREAQDDDHVVELAMSISKHGLLQPIVVKRLDNGGYQLEAGFHRLAAFCRLQRATIPAHIKEDETGSVKAIALIENIIRRDMNLAEEVKAVSYLNTTENLSASQICDLTGKGREWVNRRLMIPNLPNDLQIDLMEGNISISHAEIISKVEDDSVRALLLNQVRLGRLSARETNDLTNLYLQTPNVQEAIEAGIAKAQEIQKITSYTRRCDVCGDITRLDDIRFPATCTGCFEMIQRIFIERTSTKEEQHGN
jgi:ParB family chromosome partitioning protein